MAELNIKNVQLKGTRRETLIKFILLLLILIGYFFYLSWKYDFATGGIVSLLTWSFFVLCTPVADAGFLLDFPIRLLFGIRMIITELIVWALAFTINISVLKLAPQYYEKSFLTLLLHKIITTPVPYWSIIILCGIGTFLSIYFGDEMLDVIKHKDCQKQHKHGFKYKIIATIAIFTLIVLSYYYLLGSLGIDLKSLENN